MAILVSADMNRQKLQLEAYYCHLSTGWTAAVSAALSPLKMRGTMNASSVEERTTALMPAGTSPFQFGPTIR